MTSLKITSSLSICLYLIGYINAQTTVKPQNTTGPESFEQEYFSFSYEHNTKTLLVRTSTNCYIWSLTNAEIANIHTDSGLRQVETRVIREIDDALYTVLPPSVINANIVRLCTSGKQRVHFFLVH